jgi:tetratricopeptide (TPR) repeat protein
MARAQAQRRRRSTGSHARRSARSAEDLMFFTKLRRRAKWVFGFLAVLFALSFVVFGVGTGVSGANIGDFLRDFFGGQSSGSALEDARDEALAKPKDAEAQLAYANALQTSGQTREAISALQKYTALKPDDTDALRQLANLWGSLVAEAQQQADAAHLEAAEASAAQSFAQPSGEFLQNVEQNKIAGALAAQASARADAAEARARSAASSQQQIYAKLTEEIPDDPSLFLSLGIAAQSAGDYEAALDAYRQFLALAPTDPSAPEVKARIKLLEQQQNAGSLLQPSG